MFLLHHNYMHEQKYNICWYTTLHAKIWNPKFWAVIFLSVSLLIEKPYECEFCQGIFSQKGNLQMHITAVHLKEKPSVTFAKKYFHRNAVSKLT